MYSFGVDVGGTTVKIGLFDLEGMLLEDFEIPTRTENNGEAIPKDIAIAIDEAISRNNIKKSEIIGVGIGVPGPVFPDGTVNKCVNLGWDVINIEKIMSKECGMKVKAANDANIAALGEAWMGAGKDYESSLLMTLGTGIGGGIVIDGKILTGFRGAGGEIGHITIDEEDIEAPCNCGRNGCLEVYCSANGIVKLAKRYMSSRDIKSPLKDMRDFSAKEIFDFAKDGDGLSREILDKWADILGLGMANIATIVNTEAIILGGGMAKAGEILRAAASESFRKRAYFAASKDVKVVLATLGNKAGIYGGAKLVME